MSFIENQNVRRAKDFEHTKKPSSRVRTILCSNTTKGLAFVALFATIVPILIYYLIMDLGDFQPDDPHTCSVNPAYRIQCGRENATFDYCFKIKCCFDKDTQRCFHFLPSKYYYKLTDDDVYYTPALKQTPYSKPSQPNITLSSQEIDANTLKLILHTTDKISTTISTEKQYYYNISDDPLFAEVRRVGTNELVLTTSKGPTIVSEDYWEWSFQMSDEYLFGLGETLIELDQNSTSFTKVIYSNKLDHNTLPIFMAYKNNTFAGVTVRNKGPLEVTVIASRLVSLKTLIGDFIELEVSLGPTVKEVMAQQGRSIDAPTNASSLLGIHLCRGGDTTNLTEILMEYREFITNTSSLSYDTDCVHENLHMALLTSTDTQLKTEIFEEIKKRQAFWLSLPPQIPTNSEFYNNDSDIYFKLEDRSFNGSYRNLDVVYPDFTNERIQDFVSLLLEPYQDIANAKAMHYTLMDNWPREDTDRVLDLDAFSYMSDNLADAMSFTLPWDIMDNNNTRHIAEHNNYGASQLSAVFAEATNIAHKDDVFVMTASHNTESPHHPLLIQNVDISWENFKSSIKSLLYNSIFGHHLTSIPVCGSTSAFDYAKNEELCTRWYLMAATSPLFRISSDSPRRDPDSLVSQSAQKSAKDAIDLRNKLQPYMLNTLKNGEPIMRPMFYDFPADTKTFALDEQYMVGSQILVAHPVTPSAFQLRIYLPESVGVWYEFWGGLSYDRETMGQDGWVSIAVVEKDWVAFVKAGSIIPLLMKKPADRLELELIVASDGVNGAYGSLLIDEGSATLMLQATADNLTISDVSECNNSPITLTDIAIYTNDAPSRLWYNKMLCLQSGSEVIIKFSELRRIKF